MQLIINVLGALTAGLCAVLPNVRIMEIDIDDVAWKDELVTTVPAISGGYMAVPRGPGWGTSINEEVARAHPWNPEKVHGAKLSSPPRSY